MVSYDQEEQIGYRVVIIWRKLLQMKKKYIKVFLIKGKNSQ
jgi:hypothetical protein